MHAFHKDFLAGVREIIPILLGVIPFAMISGVSAVAVGLTGCQAMGMAAFVFAGASQFAIYQLLAINASPIVIVMTAWIINLRFIMYSASLAPYFQKLPTRTRSLLAYLITDQAYAVSINRFDKEETVNHQAYYLGTAVVMAAAWYFSSLVGIVLGSQIPASWGLDFAFPLTFMALMMPAIKDRPTAVAAIVGGSIAVISKPLPYNLGLILAAVTGILSGFAAETLQNQIHLRKIL
ncbi:MAG: AzlC family ABC transporter permease [Anaerolineales bacterium]|nr:AzlC family ABC transporter permease [Anaerolineales bacterium]